MDVDPPRVPAPRAARRRSPPRTTPRPSPPCHAPVKKLLLLGGVALHPTAYHIFMITTLPAMYLLLSHSTDPRNIGPFPPIYLYGLIVTGHVHLKGRINYL
ncbi:hypothetical protein C8R46DRAFT_1361260 [Mycena filopes]|nr:hypothetical protein C8R46DRAFT_1361260 [Mycena filopes]